jgi:hypothetical protein
VEDAEDEGYASVSDSGDAPYLQIQMDPVTSKKTYKGQAIMCPAYRPHPTFPRRTGTGSALAPSHSEPARHVAGSRRPHALPRPLIELTKHDSPPDPLDESDINLLSAVSFVTLTRQDGVHVMRTTIAELEEATKERQNYKLPDLPECEFRNIISGTGDLERYKSLLPEEFHDFLTACLNPTPSQRHRLRRISEEDAATFFSKADKPYPTNDEIKSIVPKCYHDLL